MGLGLWSGLRGGEMLIEAGVEGDGGGIGDQNRRWLGGGGESLIRVLQVLGLKSTRLDLQRC